MRYLLLLPMLLFMSCSIFQPKGQRQAVASMDKVVLKGTSWELDSLIDFTSESLERPVTMTFGADSLNKFYGNGGCNAYNGDYMQNGSKIAFSRIISTKKYCIVGSKTETKFTSVLLTANRVGMDEKGDLLLMKDGETLAILHKTDYKGE